MHDGWEVLDRVRKLQQRCAIRGLRPRLVYMTEGQAKLVAALAPGAKGREQRLRDIRQGAHLVLGLHMQIGAVLAVAGTKR